MVRQASCDVSDRNDKGSPDTVWQILGSDRSAFSCSKTSAAQTQDPARASRKETLRSEQGGLCQVLKRRPASVFYPRADTSVFLSTSQQARRGMLDWQVGPRPSRPPAPSSPAEVHVAPGSPADGQGVLRPRPVSAALNRNLSTQGPSKAPPAPAQGEVTTHSALFLLPTLSAFIHIPLGNCSGPN